MHVGPRGGRRRRPTPPRGSSPATRWAARSGRVPSTPPPRSSTASCGCSRPTTTPTLARSTALEAWVARDRRASGADGSPARHDRLVAFVSHLPQVASTALMGLAATEEADEPDILLLAAGGFRDLTRLASSNPALWSEILLVEPRGDRRGHRPVRRLGWRTCARWSSWASVASDVEQTFDEAKRARLRLAAKPQVRAGVAVLQVEAARPPGRAGASSRGRSAERDVNIEDLQIVHSPEGGRGTVHLTVAADAVDGRAPRAARRRSSTRSGWPEGDVRVRVTPGGRLRRSVSASPATSRSRTGG